MVTRKLHAVPTRNDVLDLCERLDWIYRVHVSDKKDAAEMRLVASGLEALGILDAEKFLNDFSTYLFGRVYLNFKPGTTRPAKEIVSIVHEYGHAFQDRRSGPVLEFEIDYAYVGKRAVLEAECYALGPCLAIRYPRAGFDLPEAQVLRAITVFGTSYGHVPRVAADRFERELRRRVREYARGQQPFNQHLSDVTSFLDLRLVRFA